MTLRWVGFLATIIAVTGMMGIVFVLTQVYPNFITQMLLFILLFITFAAFALPVSAYLNSRFAANTWQQLDPNRLVRHAFEAGVFVILLTYLQLIQALDWTIAAVLFGVFSLMETFFLTRV